MQTLPDYLQPHLRLDIVGFNLSICSATVWHYYAGRGNQFWPLLAEAGLIPKPLTYTDDTRVLAFVIGLADLANHSTPSSADLTTPEAHVGTRALKHKLLIYMPCVACFNSKDVYAWYSKTRAISLGPQVTRIGTSYVFVIPSTSAWNSLTSRAEKAAYFHTLQQYVRYHTEVV